MLVFVMFALIDTLLLVVAHLSNLVIKEYSVEVYEWSGTTWEPYVADESCRLLSIINIVGTCRSDF